MTERSSSYDALPRREGWALVFEDSGRVFRRDFSPFAQGEKTGRKRGRGDRRRTPLSARPILCDELLVALLEEVRAGRTGGLAGGATHRMLRLLWRELDRMQRLSAVECLADLAPLHGQGWARGGKLSRHYSNCLTLLNRARARQHLAPLDWPSLPRLESAPRKLAAPTDLQAILLKLEARARHIYSTWAHEDPHTPPLKKDVLVVFWLFLLQTGWNGCTALSIDTREPWVQAHPVAPNLRIVTAYKRRSKSYQVAVSATTPTSAVGIVECLLERTRCVRQRVLLSSGESRPSLEASARVSLPHSALAGSPWLHESKASPGQVEVLNQQNCFSLGIAPGYLESGDVAPTTSAWKQFLYEMNAERELKGKAPVAHWITLRSFRDAFIGAAYAASGGHWLAASMAAGHRSPTNTGSYLNQLEWMTHTRDRIRALQRVMWQEFARGSIDWARVRSKMSGTWKDGSELGSTP